MALSKLFTSRAVLVTLVSLLLWFPTSNARAFPQDQAPYPEDGGFYDGKPVDSFDWDIPSIDECRKQIKTPPKDKSFFFTELRSRTDINIAKSYALQHGLTSSSASYPRGFTNLNLYKGTPDQKRAFQLNFMQVFAEKTTGTAYLMLDDGIEPRPQSLFTTVEFAAMKAGGQVDRILRFPFNYPPDDPVAAATTFWTRPEGAPDYATGRCNVHITHYQILKYAFTYTVEAVITDNFNNEIGHLLRTDAAQPVDVVSKLPHVLTITVAKPTEETKVSDKFPIRFQYGDLIWTTDDASHCKIGKYDDGDREGDCSFEC